MVRSDYEGSESICTFSRRHNDTIITSFILQQQIGKLRQSDCVCRCFCVWAYGVCFIDVHIFQRDVMI